MAPPLLSWTAVLFIAALDPCDLAMWLPLLFAINFIYIGWYWCGF